MTGPDNNDYAVLRFEACPIYVIVSWDDLEGCFIHGLYRSYYKACDALLNFCVERVDCIESSDDVTDILTFADYEFPGGMRTMADYFEALHEYG